MRRAIAGCIWGWDRKGRIETKSQFRLRVLVEEWGLGVTLFESDLHIFVVCPIRQF